MYSKSELFNPPHKKGMLWKIIFAMTSALKPFSDSSKEVIEEVTNFVVNMLSLYPVLVRFFFIVGLLLFDFHTMFYSFRRVSRLKPQKRVEVLNRWLHSKGIVRNFARALLVLINSAFFEHPVYIKRIGYPWV